MAEIINLAKYRRAKRWAAFKKRLEQGPPIVIPTMGPLRQYTKE